VSSFVGRSIRAVGVGVWRRRGSKRGALHARHGALEGLEQEDEQEASAMVPSTAKNVEWLHSVQYTPI
jgi:hypothetical protein